MKEPKNDRNYLQEVGPVLSDESVYDFNLDTLESMAPGEFGTFLKENIKVMDFKQDKETQDQYNKILEEIPTANEKGLGKGNGGIIKLKLGNGKSLFKLRGSDHSYNFYYIFDEKNHSDNGQEETTIGTWGPPMNNNEIYEDVAIEVGGESIRGMVPSIELIPYQFFRHLLYLKHKLDEYPNDEAIKTEFQQFKENGRQAFNTLKSCFSGLEPKNS